MLLEDLGELGRRNRKLVGAKRGGGGAQFATGAAETGGRVRAEVGIERAPIGEGAWPKGARRAIEAQHDLLKHEMDARAARAATAADSGSVAGNGFYSQCCGGRVKDERANLDLAAVGRGRAQHVRGERQLG